MTVAACGAAVAASTAPPRTSAALNPTISISVDLTTTHIDRPEMELCGEMRELFRNGRETDPVPQGGHWSRWAEAATSPTRFAHYRLQIGGPIRCHHLGPRG